MSSTKDDLSVVLFKMLVAGLSLAITLPSLITEAYHVFMLTTFVFILGKLVDSLDNFIKASRREVCVIYAVGCILGIVSLMFCLFYLGLMFDNSVTKEIQNDNSNNLLLNGISLWLIPFLVSAFYIIADLYYCSCVMYKYYATKKQIIKYQKI